MRILQLISSSGFFGAENAVVNLCKELHQKNIQVYLGIITTKNTYNQEFIDAAHGCGISMLEFNCNSRIDFNTIYNLRKFLKQNNIDIIHCHNYKSNFYGLLASMMLKIKRTATIHNWIKTDYKLKIYSFLDKLIIRKFNTLVVMSEAVKQEIMETGIKRNKLVFIANGVDIDRFAVNTDTVGLKRQLGIDMTQKIVGSIGRLAQEKGHIYLIKAFKIIISDYPNTKLLIVGNGELIQNLKSQVTSLQLEDKVVFTGMRTDIPEILSIMDIFVLPSLIEAMPMVLLEAMASKKTIIATNVGSVSRIIRNNETGILINPADIDSLAKGIIYFFKNNSDGNTMVNNAYNLVKSTFSANTMAQSYLKLYSSLLKDRSC